MDINIYPNPSRGKLFICGMEKGTELSICNQGGEEVHHSVPVNTQSMVDLGEQPEGVYFIKINTNEGEHNKKVVLVK